MAKNTMTQQKTPMGSVKLTNENQLDQCSISLRVNDVPMVFRIDAGADVTVISEQAFNNFFNVSLRLTNETLLGPERQQLRVRGKFNAKVTHNGLSSYQDIFVVKSLSQPLLGWPAIQALNLVHIVNNVGNGNLSKYRDKFWSLFQGLGKFGEEYSIKMIQDFKPFCLSTPSCVPLPLQNEAIKQLKEMEDTGVISPVTLPAEWCSGMVVVPKNPVRSEFVLIILISTICLP